MEEPIFWGGVILQLLKVTGAEIFVKKKNTPPCAFCIMITVENLMCGWLY